MKSVSPLRLRALATKYDRLWVPQLEQVKILIKGLLYVCNLLEPAILPKKEFTIQPS
jgi:hypothetical protein